MLQTTLEKLNSICKKYFDIDMSKYDDSFVSKIISGRMMQTNTNNETEYLNYVEINGDECRILCDSLLISHSEFFRMPYSYEVLQNGVFPEMSFRQMNKKERSLRIWSMACAAGQEVYSLSVLLQEFNTKNKNKIKYGILGTDISKRQVQLARKAEYDSFSLRNVSMGRLNDFFDIFESGYKVKPMIKDNVNFATFDLLSEKNKFPPESIFGGFDIIICANILYYYRPEYQKVIVNRILQSLNKDGYLITDPSERKLVGEYGFRELVKDSCVFYRM
jgi:chemotaxis protein methyltransferase CheR